MEKTDDTRKMGRKDEVFRSFSGWLSDIITARPSLLVFSLVSLPSFSISTLSPFLVSTCPSSPPVFRLTVLSLSVPTGLRGQHGEISDQFFKPRVPRLYTPWETTLGWAQSEISTLGSRGLVLRCRGSGWGWNQAAKKIKRRIRRILKGSRPGCSRTFITAMYPATALTSSPISSPQHLNTSLSLSLSSWPADFFSSVKSTPCENDTIALRLIYLEILSFLNPLLSRPSSFTLSCLDFLALTFR